MQTEKVVWVILGPLNNNCGFFFFFKTFEHFHLSSKDVKRVKKQRRNGGPTCRRAAAAYGAGAGSGTGQGRRVDAWGGWPCPKPWFLRFCWDRPIDE